MNFKSKLTLAVGSAALAVQACMPVAVADGTKYQYVLGDVPDQIPALLVDIGGHWHFCVESAEVDGPSSAVYVCEKATVLS